MSMSSLIHEKLKEIYRNEYIYGDIRKPIRKFHERSKCLAYTYRGQDCGQITDDRENLYINGNGDFFVVVGRVPLNFTRDDVDVIPLSPDEVKVWKKEMAERLTSDEEENIDIALQGN